MSEGTDTSSRRPRLTKRVSIIDTTGEGPAPVLLTTLGDQDEEAKAPIPSTSQASLSTSAVFETSKDLSTASGLHDNSGASGSIEGDGQGVSKTRHVPATKPGAVAVPHSPLIPSSSGAKQRQKQPPLRASSSSLSDKSQKKSLPPLPSVSSSLSSPEKLNISETAIEPSVEEPSIGPLNASTPPTAMSSSSSSFSSSPQKKGTPSSIRSSIRSSRSARGRAKKSGDPETSAGAGAGAGAGTDDHDDDADDDADADGPGAAAAAAGGTAVEPQQDTSKASFRPSSATSPGVVFVPGVADSVSSVISEEPTTMIMTTTTNNNNNNSNNSLTSVNNASVSTVRSRNSKEVAKLSASAGSFGASGIASASGGSSRSGGMMSSLPPKSPRTPTTKKKAKAEAAAAAAALPTPTTPGAVSVGGSAPDASFSKNATERSAALARNRAARASAASGGAEATKVGAISVSGNANDGSGSSSSILSLKARASSRADAAGRATVPASPGALRQKASADDDVRNKVRAAKPSTSRFNSSHSEMSTSSSTSARKSRSSNKPLVSTKLPTEDSDLKKKSGRDGKAKFNADADPVSGAEMVDGPVTTKDKGDFKRSKTRYDPPRDILDRDRSNSAMTPERFDEESGGLTRPRNDSLTRDEPPSPGRQHQGDSFQAYTVPPMDSCDILNAPVVAFDVYQAERIEEGKKRKESEERRSSLTCKCFIALMAILTAGAVVGITFGVMGKKDPAAAPIPTPLPTGESPTAAPTFDDTVCVNSESPGDLSERYGALRPIVSEDPSNIDTPGTVQRKALCWLAFFDKHELEAVESNARALVQRYSMAVLYYSFIAGNGSPLERPAWLAETHECEWERVVCDSDTLDIEGLDLEDTKLKGSFPPEIANFKSLVSLDFFNNDAMGTLPPSFWTLSSLRTLDLGGNDLSGTLPTDFSGVPQLKTLLLYQNQFSGPIPLAVGELRELVELEVSSTKVNGTIPEAIATLTDLSHLNLGGSGRLTGTIPIALSKLTKLSLLYLFKNRLEGEIPSEIAQISSLEYLDLGSNILTGTIPTEIGLCTNLLRLGVNINRLTGEIPTELGNLSNAVSMKFDSNADLMGSLPSEICALTQLTTLKHDGPCECCFV